MFVTFSFHVLHQEDVYLTDLTYALVKWTTGSTNIWFPFTQTLLKRQVNPLFNCN